MDRLIFIIIIAMFYLPIFAENSASKIDKSIPPSILNELYNYSDNYFRKVLKERTLDLKDNYKKIINNKYIAGADLSHSMIVKRVITKCVSEKNCHVIKTDFLNYNANKELFENLFKQIDNPHFLPFYLDKEKVKSNQNIKPTKMFSNGEYATFAKDNSKKDYVTSTNNTIKTQDFNWLGSNGKIIIFPNNATFKHNHKINSGEYSILTLIISDFSSFTHIRPIKENLKKINISFSDNHKETNAEIVYKRLGPGYKQNDFEQTVKLEKNVANNPKEKFTTGHYNVTLKNAFCGCEYPLDENKILDTYDKELKEQYEHNFKVELVEGDITGGLKSPSGNTALLKGKAVQLIPACEDGGLEKSKLSLTNNEGKFTFPSMPKGVYKIKVGDKILGEVKHCRAKAKLTYVGKFNYNPNLYDLELIHKMYSKNEYVGKLEMKLKEIDLQAYPFCEPKYKDVVNVYPPSKIPPYLDKSLEGFNYTFLTKVITDIKDVKYDDYTKMKKHMKCRVSNTDRMFSIRGTLKPLTVPTVGGTLSKNSVYLDYKFSIECLIPQANIWVPRWLITAMPTPEKFSKLYKFSKLDDKSIKNIWNKKAFEFKSPIYKVGNLSQQLILKGEIEGDKCTKYFTETECSQAYRTKDIQSIKTLEESSPFDCEEEKTPETKKDACQPEGGIVDEWACEEQKEREKKEKESSSTTSGDQENKTDEPVPGESLGGEKNTDSSNKKKNNDPPDDW